MSSLTIKAYLRPLIQSPFCTTMSAAIASPGVLVYVCKKFHQLNIGPV